MLSLLRSLQTVFASGLLIVFFAINPHPRAAWLHRQQPQAAGNSSVSGVVLLSTNGQTTPVRRARVMLRTEAGFLRTVDTDVLGRFLADGLPAGMFAINVDKPGFVLLGHAPVIELSPGSVAKPIILMRRGAAIEGRLLSGDGQPTPGLTVSAIRLGFGPYGKKVVSAQQTTTDDLGRFRLPSLSPGEYFLEAEPDPLRMRDAPGAKPIRTYYPDTSRVDEAGVISLAPEQQVTNIVLTVRSELVATVGATVLTSSGRPPATFSVRVQRVGAGPGEVRCLLPPAEPKGERTFQCPNVPPGDFWFTVSARESSQSELEFAATRVNVTGQDLTGLVITTAPGVRLAGHVEEEGGRPLPSRMQVVALDSDYEFPNPTPSAGGTAVQPVMVESDGTFTFNALAGPRLFRMLQLPEGWALKGVWLDGSDISDRPIALQSSERPPLLRVVVTSSTGSVEGLVVNAENQPATGSYVVVLADDGSQWFARTRFVRATKISASGRYTITGLLPAKYKVAFVDDLSDGSWEDPDVLRGLSLQGTSITITSVERFKVDGRIR